MIAILKRELKAYFTSVIGWIFMAAFFFVFNLYFVANNLIYGTPYLSYSLNNVAFVLLIIIPILAMRSMSDDRRTKTDQLLYTSPVSVPKVILGKFLALVLVFSIVVGAIRLCPLLLSRFGSIPMAESYAAILGLLAVRLPVHLHLCLCLFFDRESGDCSSIILCVTVYRLYDGGNHKHYFLQWKYTDESAELSVYFQCTE